MKRVTITGGLGFLGRSVARLLLAEGAEVTLFDVEGPPDEPGCTVVRGRVGDADALGAALPEGTNQVFHLASMVSAECEEQFDDALDVNLHGALAVLDACRRLPAPPRFVFASSVAVYGGDSTSNRVADTTKQTPVTTYGVTKAIGELLVNEYTRKGFIDGRTARLPTVVVRPGRPNRAASSFASGMFREPLAGESCTIPVPADTRLCIIGHQRAVAGLIALADLDGAALGADRAVGLPALEASVGELEAQLRQWALAHGRALGAISYELDEAITAVVGSWPGSWDSARALALGLPADRDLGQILDDFAALLANLKG